MAGFKLEMGSSWHFNERFYKLNKNWYFGPLPEDDAKFTRNLWSAPNITNNINTTFEFDSFYKQVERRLRDQDIEVDYQAVTQ